MQITQGGSGNLLRIDQFGLKFGQRQKTRRRAITAHLLALPILLARAYYIWRFTLIWTLRDEVIRRQ